MNQATGSAPMPSTIPLSEQSITTPAPLTPRNDSKSKMFIFMAVIILITGAVFGGFYVMASNQKKEISKLTQAQIKNFTNIQSQYSQILQNLSDSGEEAENTSNELLKNNSEVNSNKKIGENVLGLEDSDLIQEQRILGALYKKSLEGVNTVEETNTSIKKAFSTPFTKLLVSYPAELLTETDNYSKDTKNVLGYMDTMNSSGIKFTTIGFEIGSAMNESIQRNADEESIKKIERKIQEMDTEFETLKSIKTDGLPDTLKKDHMTMISTYPEQKKLFTDIVDALREKNATKLLNLFQSLAAEGATESETAIVEMVTFWREDFTINSVNTLKAKWQKYNATLK